MSKKQAELKARLLAEAEAAIDRLLQASKGRRDLSMTEMEDLVGDLETDFRQTVMQELVNDSQAKGNGLCPACQGKLRNTGKKRKRIITVRGEVEVERDYYVCQACDTSYFPPG